MDDGYARIEFAYALLAIIAVAGLVCGLRLIKETDTMDGNVDIHFSAPKTITSMCEAFREHCHDGGGDFTQYLKDWDKSDALATINDAAQRYQPEAAIEIIKKALSELFEIAAQGHREALEWEGIE